MKKVLTILGPTATGKTDLALYLAKKFNGELVSVDSRQVYTGLDIGTGKSPGSGKWEVRRGNKRWEVGRVNIWMYDVVSPKIQYTVADYVRDAGRVVTEIREKGKLPIIVGGTGLYLKALLEGIPNLAIPVDKRLRDNLAKLSREQLQEKLKEISLGKWETLNESDRENPRRLVRAIELAVLKHEGDPSLIARDDNLRQGLRKLSNVLKVGLTAPREVLYKRVDERVVARIEQGMIKEAKRLHKSGLSLKRLKQLGLEYGILADYLSGKIREIEGDQGLIKIMQNKIHGYVRRQLTWFKKEKDVVWFDITGKYYPTNVEKIIDRWYHHPDDAKNRYFS